jgi:hypothetical protein
MFVGFIAQGNDLLVNQEVGLLRAKIKERGWVHQNENQKVENGFKYEN